MSVNRILLAKGPGGSNLDQLFEVKNRTSTQHTVILNSDYDLSFNLYDTVLAPRTANIAHNENTSTTLAANNNKRGKYTFTTNATIADNEHSVTFTVQNNKCKVDSIVIMNCTSNHLIEVHTFNVSVTGWDLFIVNRTGDVLSANTVLVFNFIILN